MLLVSDAEADGLSIAAQMWRSVDRTAKFARQVQSAGRIPCGNALHEINEFLLSVGMT
jgi:hypothetical protein